MTEKSGSGVIFVPVTMRMHVMELISPDFFYTIKKRLKRIANFRFTTGIAGKGDAG